MPSIHVPPASGRGTSLRAVDSKTKQAGELETALPALDALSEELNKLAAINAELVGQLRGAAHAGPAADLAAVDRGELTSLRNENAGLRERIEELEKTLASQATEDIWAERQREYEALLEEKSEVIRTLHLKIQELQEGTRRAANAPIPREEELVQLKEELEEQRRQLSEDEESLMAQMRQMEMAMSKDRAELARQRQEVQRLQAELNRDVEQASRDNGLQERLNTLRRRPDPAKKEPAVETAGEGESKQGSGLLRRLFG
jgi:DNA repair exonuclease SbcCD ATPase subunit